MLHTVWPFVAFLHFNITSLNNNKIKYGFMNLNKLLIWWHKGSLARLFVDVIRPYDNHEFVMIQSFSAIEIDELIKIALVISFRLT